MSVLDPPVAIVILSHVHSRSTASNVVLGYFAVKVPLAVNLHDFWRSTCRSEDTGETQQCLRPVCQSDLVSPPVIGHQCHVVMIVVMCARFCNKTA